MSDGGEPGPRWLRPGCDHVPVCTQIVRQDRSMEQIVFPVPGICQFLTEETKHRLFTTTEQDEQGSKVSDFFDQSSFLHNEMEWQRKLRSEDPSRAGGQGWAWNCSVMPPAEPPPHVPVVVSLHATPRRAPATFSSCSGAWNSCRHRGPACGGWTVLIRDPHSRQPATTLLPQACH